MKVKSTLMHMKRFSLPLLALALCLFGCTPKENPTPTPDPKPDPKPDPPTEQVVPAKVTLNETSVSLTGEGSKVVTFTSATDWKAAVASGGSSWLTVSPTSGSAGTTSVTVKAKANPTYDDRETTFTITGTGKDGSTSTGTVHVTQAATLGMVVEQKAFEVPAAGGTVTVKVKANTDYTYIIDASGQGWITETTTRALTEYTHTFKVDANDRYDSRQGTITFKNTKTGETDQVRRLHHRDGESEHRVRLRHLRVLQGVDHRIHHPWPDGVHAHLQDRPERPVRRTHRRHHLPGYEDRRDGGSAGQAGHFPGVRGGTGGAHGHLQCPGRAELGIPRILGYGSAGHLVAEYPV